jgi:hypothetical protein
MLPANLRPDLDALRVDVAVAALRDVVKDGWSVLALSTGMADAFGDQSGIASLGGGAYASGAVSNLASPTLISGGTAIGANLTGGGGYAAAFDGNTNQIASASAYNGSSPAYGAVGKNWGGATKTVKKFTAYKATSLAGFCNTAGLLLKFQGHNGSSWVDLWSGTDTGAASVTVTSGLSTSTAYTDHRFYVQGNSVNDIAIAELQMYEGGGAVAATVVSNAFALGFQPSLARIVAPMEVGSGVLGTDGLLDLSRDGSTWAAVPLSDLGKFDSNTRIVGGLVNLAGQPAGSSIYWRWRTTSGIAQALHGVWLQCK